jgi:hypothetical protein
MKSRLVAMLLITFGISHAAGEFRYEVKRDKLWRSERGVLTVNEQGMQYRSENGKTALDFAFADIRKADVSDPRKVRLYTYDRAKMRFTQPREHEFELREGATNAGLAQFLAGRMERPILGAYELANAGAEIPAYHRHALGGCHGVLRFGPLAIQFESKDPTDSRTWVYADIETVGTMSPFHFRLTSYAETYNFDLKERLSPEDYRTVWHRVYTADFQTSESGKMALAPQGLTF